MNLQSYIRDALSAGATPEELAREFSHALNEEEAARAKKEAEDRAKAHEFIDDAYDRVEEAAEDSDFDPYDAALVALLSIDGHGNFTYDEMNNFVDSLTVVIKHHIENYKRETRAKEEKEKEVIAAPVGNTGAKVEPFSAVVDELEKCYPNATRFLKEIFEIK